METLSALLVICDGNEMNPSATAGLSLENDTIVELFIFPCIYSEQACEHI